MPPASSNSKQLSVPDIEERSSLMTILLLCYLEQNVGASLETRARLTNAVCDETTSAGTATERVLVVPTGNLNVIVGAPWVTRGRDGVGGPSGKREGPRL